MDSVSDDGDGISWQNIFYFSNHVEGDIKTGNISQKIPLVAGENVTFSYDEENNAIAINATGGADASTLATIDKIREIDTNYSNTTSFNQYGIVTEQDTSIYYTLDEGDSVYISFKNRLPIVAGENVTFELNEEDQVVKINATGGGSDDSMVGTWVFKDEITLPQECVK